MAIRKYVTGTALVAALAGLLVPAPARADGDPASDVLYSQWVFLPSDASVRAGQRAELEALVREARGAGLPIKVALVDSPYDLGSVTALWRKPQLYARFLGTELSLVFRGRLLVVMPNGLGVARAGKTVATDEPLLRQARIGSGGSGLAAAAIAVIDRLAAAHAVTLATPEPASVARPPSRTNWAAWIGFAVGAAAIAGAVAASVVLRPPSLLRRLARRGPAIR